MYSTARVPAALVALLTALMISSPAAANDPLSQSVWNQWRGPSRDGVVAGADWPDDLTHLAPVWRVELGASYSGPIVSGDRVFVTETIDNSREAVRALERSTGRELWRISWEANGKVPFFAAANGEWIRSTPAYDGEALYVGGMEEVLVKLEGETGRELWRVDFPKRFGTKVPDFGFASSPLVTGEHVYVQAANSLVKLDKESGATVWRSLESSGDIMMSGAFSSPMFASLAGREQLVVQTRLALHGLDPEDGEVLWTQPVPSFRGMNILTPAVHGNSILTSTYKNKTYYYSISGSADDLRSTEVWTHKSPGYMSSPVVVDGHAYLHLGSGRLICLDLETGMERWASPPLGKYSSLVAQQDKLLTLGEDGDLRLVRATPERFELLDTKQVGSQPTWAHLAVSGNEIVVRELNAVAVFRWQQQGGDEPAAK